MKKEVKFLEFDKRSLYEPKVIEGIIIEQELKAMP